MDGIKRHAVARRRVSTGIIRRIKRANEESWRGGLPARGSDRRRVEGKIARRIRSGHDVLTGRSYLLARLSSCPSFKPESFFEPALPAYGGLAGSRVLAPAARRRKKQFERRDGRASPRGNPRKDPRRFTFFETSLWRPPALGGSLYIRCASVDSRDLAPAVTRH